ncbi:MAG TPA: nucleotide exchange factor GrpE [Pyrinomonadaceae bacterium]|nr:nucleotide exchange factor GrpE [Pyrinomonadaceae bacterium]
MRNHRTRNRRIASLVITLVSSLSLIIIDANADNTRRPPDRPAAETRMQSEQPNSPGRNRAGQGGAVDPQDSPLLEEIKNKFRRIDSNFAQKGLPRLNVEERLRNLRADNAPDVVNPLLKTTHERLSRAGVLSEPFDEIRGPDAASNLDRIGERLDNYVLSSAKLSDAGAAQTSNANQNADNDGGGGGGFSLLGLGQVALAALSLPALLLGAGAVLLFLRMRGNLAQVKHDVRKVATAVSKMQPASASASAQTPSPLATSQPARTPAPSDGLVEQLSKQLRDQQQAINLLTTQVGTIENRAAAGEKRATDSIEAVEQVTRWLTRMHMRGAEGDVYEDEAERAAALAALERHNERLHANATVVEPLTQAIASLVDTLEARPSSSPELLARVQRLYHDIGQFDQWAVTCDAQLGALRRGSMDERRVKFHSEQRQLDEQLRAGRVSVAQYINQFSRMLEQHFPPGANNGVASAQTPVASLSEEQLTQYVEGAPEYLMDWFSTFSQLQSQAQAAQVSGAGVDSETLDALATVQRAAREVLSRFDIQPEEIYVGRTTYDRHLHDAAMIRQTSQFPVNTVIEVHRAGFRRVSTGEVLRRPQVIVAGSGA